MDASHSPNDKNRPNDKDEKKTEPSASQKPSEHVPDLSQFDFGEIEREGAGVFSFIDAEGKMHLTSGGPATEYERAIVYRPTVTADQFKMAGVKSLDQAFNFLKGDSGSAQTSAGYTQKYAAGWDTAFGAKQSEN